MEDGPPTYTSHQPHEFSRLYRNARPIFTPPASVMTDVKASALITHYPHLYAARVSDEFYFMEQDPARSHNRPNSNVLTAEIKLLRKFTMNCDLRASASCAQRHVHVSVRILAVLRSTPKYLSAFNISKNVMMKVMYPQGPQPAR